MDQATFSPAVLQGTVRLPPSKSIAHRALLCASLASGTSRISPVSDSQDLEATQRCIRALGASAERDGQALLIGGTGAYTAERPVLNCGESGSTLRFLIPVAAANGVRATFTGSGRLPHRPIGCYLDCLPAAGVCCETAGGLPLTIGGRLRSGRFTLPGNVSSQFVTGLLLALPLLDGDSAVVLTSPLESASYVALTLDVMARFGVTAFPSADGFFIPGGQRYRACDFTVEGDWSQAAFFLAAGLLGSTLRLEGLRRDSKQGDRACLALFRQMGAALGWDGDTLTVSPGVRRAVSFDASQIPDLVPPLAAAAAFCPGRTEIVNAARLRAKESDRLQSTAALLRALGVPAAERPDGLVIEGGRTPSGGDADGANDHRIVMAAAVAALACAGPVTVTGAYSIRKSYPTFFEEYNRLGGNAHVFDLG